MRSGDTGWIEAQWPAPANVRAVTTTRAGGCSAAPFDAFNLAMHVGDDPVHKLLAGREPVRGERLASQSTLSRFENSFGRADLLRMGLALSDAVLAFHHRRLRRDKVRRITIDLDPTEDPTHGQQEFTVFNGHYDTWCYLPLVAPRTFDAEPMQYLVAAVLRPVSERNHLPPGSPS